MSRNSIKGSSSKGKKKNKRRSLTYSTLDIKVERHSSYSNFDIIVIVLGNRVRGFHRHPCSRLTRIQNGGEARSGARVHIPCNRISTPSSFSSSSLSIRYTNSIIIFSRNLGISIRRSSTFPFERSTIRRGCDEKGIYIYIYILSRLGAELRGGDPFAMQVTPHPPSRYLPASASCTCARTPINAVCARA